MCGIIGILGAGDVAGDLLSALKRLEYRGYDSAGVAILNQGRLSRRRAPGKVAELAEVVKAAPAAGSSGIGHIRWATHGAPTEGNAHPHLAGPVALVHNGIIENFRELKAEVEASGRSLTSETDTETVAQFCAMKMDEGLTPQEAVAATLKRVEGAFALLFLFEGHDDLMIASRRGAPLAIGWGEGEMYVGSDALALAPLSTRITYLEEGDMAVVTRAGAEIVDAEGQPATRQQRYIPAGSALADKGEHRHFMAKEIHEQPTVMGYAVAACLTAEGDRVLSPLEEIDFSGVGRVFLVACGTAYYACHVAKYWIESIARIPAEIEVASEFRYREPPLSKTDIAIFVSQSGETADTLAALEYARERVGKTIALVNVEESSIARKADIALPIRAGIEVSVASTKAFTCQLLNLAILAILLARKKGRIDAEEEARLCRLLTEAPRRLAEVLTQEADIAKTAQDMATARDVLYLGRGAMYPLALEGALKLKELSYIHAEGYASGEMKHGPIALIDTTVPVVVMAPSDPLFGKSVSNMEEVMARGAKVALFTDQEGAKAAGAGVWRLVTLPAVDPFIAPIVYAAPAQLLAYHAALAKGTDVDQPRNLAKSVTVE